MSIQDILKMQPRLNLFLFTTGGGRETFDRTELLLGSIDIFIFYVRFIPSGLARAICSCSSELNWVWRGDFLTQH